MTCSCVLLHMMMLAIDHFLQASGNNFPGHAARITLSNAHHIFVHCILVGGRNYWQSLARACASVVRPLNAVGSPHAYFFWQLVACTLLPMTCWHMQLR